MDGKTAKARARLAGLLYLILMVLALFAEVGVRGSLIVSNDAAATARNILGSEWLFRLGGAADLVTFVCDAALAALLYEILKPAGPSVALQAMIFRIVYCAMISALTFTIFVPITILKGGGLGAFSSPQLQALAFLMLKMHSAAYGVALVFFGVHVLLMGYLIARSRYLPLWLGLLLAVAGACYVVNSAINLLIPQFSLYPFILAPGFVAELSLTLWLLIVGLNATEWDEAMARRASSS